MAQMSMDDDPHPLELFEVAVNRREVDVWSLDLDRLRQLFGRPMARCVEECVEKKASRAVTRPPCSLTRVNTSSTVSIRATDSGVVLLATKCR